MDNLNNVGSIYPVNLEENTSLEDLGMRAHEVFQQNEAMQQCFHLPEIVDSIISYLLPQNKFSSIALASVSKLFQSFLTEPRMQLQCRTWIEEHQELKKQVHMFDLEKPADIEGAIELIIENKLQVANLSAFKGLTNQMLEELFAKNPDIKHLLINADPHSITSLPRACSNLETFICNGKIDFKKIFSHDWRHPGHSVLDRNKAICLAAVRQNGLNLQYTYMKDDKEVVLAAVRQNGLALEHADYLLKKNKEVALAAVQQNGLALQHVYWRVQVDDKEVALAAVKQNGLALKLAYWRVQNNKKLALAAAQQSNLADKY